MVTTNVIGLRLLSAQCGVYGQTWFCALRALRLIAAKVHVEQTLQQLVSDQGDTKLWR